ncbi:hypothetical protein EZV62_015129 [Acer yangbiense]|uniref:J domain-containing protein n=1 Tax=Acer yangbiense TaxID=1000413 RepID=A0A5C7HW59_9ROSI|nr:hypothetical protein EZV62_015129 [Acer yangbiense]
MQIPRWRNVFTLKNSLTLSSLSSRTAVAAEKSALSVASFHSTPTSFEKRKNKWNAQDAGRAQQPTKSYVRYQTRQKRADAKKALKDLLFSSGSSKHSFQPFQNDDPIWKFDGTNEWGAESDTKGQSKSSARQFGKNDRKKMKRKNRRENFYEDFDDRDPEKMFQAKFGKKWYTWSFPSWKGSSFESSPSGFEWQEHSNTTNHKTKDWETVSEAESDDELCAVGSSSDRTILGLPTRGCLTIEAVKNAFRSSALKWHPDKHQGPSQAMAEEKFKLCVNAYKSLCDALS